MNELHKRLLKAHETNDTPALVALYQEAANQSNDPEAAGFYRTHAYVFALEIGHIDTKKLRDRLIADGRESRVAD